jgi:hypothetical protein
MMMVSPGMLAISPGMQTVGLGMLAANNRLLRGILGVKLLLKLAMIK